MVTVFMHRGCLCRGGGGHKDPNRTHPFLKKKETELVPRTGTYQRSQDRRSLYRVDRGMYLGVGVSSDLKPPVLEWHYPRALGVGGHREEGLLWSPEASDVWIWDNRWAKHPILPPLLLIILDTVRRNLPFFL